MSQAANLNNRLRQRIHILRWVMPIVLTLFVFLFQFVFPPDVRSPFDSWLHIDSEVAIYGVLGPLLVFWALTTISIWIDENERNERRARKNERRLASITAESADAILSLDEAGRIETWNRGAELLFGYSAGQIIGESFSRLLGGGEAGKVELDWLLTDARKEGVIRNHEAIAHRADRTLATIELTMTRVDDDQDLSLGVSVIARDITERKRREEDVRRLNVSLNEQVNERTRELATKVEELARSNEALQQLDKTRSEFVSMVSHQIRAPLTNLRGAVDRMQSDCTAMTTTCSRMFIILQEQIARLERLVRNVLSATRIDGGELTFNSEPVSILPLVNQAVEQIQARARLRPLRMLPKPGLPLVLADRDLVTEVVINLLDNADKYSPPGTEITVDVSANQTAVTVAVSDQGRGIEAADRERIFDKFYRPDHGDAQVAYGYGLGLYVCRKLIEAQGGKVWVETGSSGGSVFQFTLPVWQEKRIETDDPGH